ncbi:orotate phosphoribosyltransferase [Ramaria rubella]|nr:orotate phosphoribosyltransferase [Ramaria rubella]
MANTGLEEYQKKLISAALSAGVLKFGSFELKSGRISPYFFNAALLNTGPLIETLASAYATHIALSLSSSAIPHFDVIFGPAYKGIPLAATVALLLWRDHHIDVGWAYDRKEAKAHGEGGVLVGASIDDKRVLILDDVITAGTAIRIALDNIAKANGKVIGVVVCLDREEIGSTAPPGETNSGQRLSTVNQVAREIGGPVRALVRMRDLISWLEEQGRQDDLKQMKAYWEEYGIEG